MLYIRDDDWRDCYKDAASIIIPMAGRYDWFKDRNKSIEERWEMIPNNLQWLMNTYMGKFKMDECVESVGFFSSLSGTYGQTKNVSTALQTSYISPVIKPAEEFTAKIKHKPTVISLTVATSAFNFDVKNYNFNTPNELICEQDNKPIVGAITRALTKAINERVDPTNKNIFITPLFRNNLYLPVNDKSINTNWNVANYINSLILALDRYDLDKFNIHVFIRTQPRIVNVN